MLLFCAFSFISPYLTPLILIIYKIFLKTSDETILVKRFATILPNLAPENTIYWQAYLINAFCLATFNNFNYEGHMQF